MAQSLKQKWVSERLFINNGSLLGIITRLNQIAKAPSTLVSEANLIYNAVYAIQQIDLKKSQEASWIQYKERRG
ncbi:hypothetical protein MUP59_08690 [Candidatus Bathyarchaeota archaeon]|nr:hypothetical protein [Candidatus Bathyarchaeota archaeon]